FGRSQHMLHARAKVLAFLVVQVADDLQRAPFLRCWSPADLIVGQAGEHGAEDLAVSGELVEEERAVHGSDGFRTKVGTAPHRWPLAVRGRNTFAACRYTHER